MTTAQLQSFEALLVTWNDHQDLRLRGGSITELVESRHRLDDVRLRHRHRLVASA